MIDTWIYIRGESKSKPSFECLLQQIQKRISKNNTSINNSLRTQIKLYVIFFNDYKNESIAIAKPLA